MRKQRGLQGGQTLLEILLAFSISIMVLGAVIFGVTASLSNTQYTKNQNLANSYAQEGMAVVKQIRDSSWDTFRNSYSSNTAYCLGPNLTDLKELTSPSANCWAQSPVPAGGIFSREIEFEHDAPSCKADPACAGPSCIMGSKVMVKVSWSDNKCPAGAGDPLCHNVELITCLSNVDLKPTP